MNKRTRFTPNEIIDCGNYYEICLYSGLGKQTEIIRTKIDKDDLEKVKNHKWGIQSKGYARNGKNNILLHQYILGKKKGFEIDHINHNKLDNRKQNLRHCTGSQNQMNRKSKGYCFNKSRNKWLSYIEINKKRIYLGYFNNEQDTIKARQIAVKKYFGEFAFNH